MRAAEKGRMMKRWSVPIQPPLADVPSVKLVIDLTADCGPDEARSWAEAICVHGTVVKKPSVIQIPKRRRT